MSIGWNRRITKFIFVDLVLALLAVFFGTIFVTTLLPVMFKLNPVISICLCIVCLYRPLYVFFIKGEPVPGEKSFGWTRRTKKFGIFEEKIAQAGLIFLMLAVGHFHPNVFRMNLWISLILTIICAYDPLWIFWVRDEK